MKQLTTYIIFFLKKIKEALEISFKHKTLYTSKFHVLLNFGTSWKTNWPKLFTIAAPTWASLYSKDLTISLNVMPQMELSQFTNKGEKKNDKNSHAWHQNNHNTGNNWKQLENDFATKKILKKSCLTIKKKRTLLWTVSIVLYKTYKHFMP